MKQFFKEFKAFISKGNALDLAIGLVLGTAFNNIVKSLVNDVIMPLFSLIGGRSMSAWFFVLRGTQSYNETLGTYVFSEDAIVLYYGQFLNSILDFFIIGLSIFLTLKLLKKMDHALDEIKDKIHPDKRDEKMKTFDPEKLHPRAFYSLFSGIMAPRLIAWVSSLNDDKSVNIAPYSFFFRCKYPSTNGCLVYW